jgi:hypothetical protein
MPLDEPNCNTPFPGGMEFTSRSVTCLSGSYAAPPLRRLWQLERRSPDAGVRACRAEKSGWIIISMKDDWKRMFSFEQ